MALLSILDVACPSCRAPIGAQCVYIHTVDRERPHKRTTPHASRRLSYRDANVTGPASEDTGPVTAAETDEVHEAARDDGNTATRTTRL